MARAAGKKSAPPARDDKALAFAITAAPRLTDRKAAQARVTAWLTEIGRSATGQDFVQQRVEQRIVGFQVHLSIQFSFDALTQLVLGSLHQVFRAVLGDLQG